MTDVHDHGPFAGHPSGDLLAPPATPGAGPPTGPPPSAAAETTPPRAGATRHEPERRSRLRGWLSAAAVGAIVGSTVSAGVLVGMDQDGGTSPAPTPAAATASFEGPPENLVQQVLATVEPATVAITTAGSVQGPFGRSGVSGAGTGMVLEADGLIVTNAHVVAGASQIEVRSSDGTIRSAALVGTDTAHDVAVIRAEGMSGHPTVSLAPDDELEVGETVVAIGNALGLDGGPTVTEGILSAIGRDIQTTDAELTGLVQTDAAINPGNSGGPLVDADGRVVGMNTAVAGQAQNIGFAVSADAVQASVDDILAGGGDPTGAPAAGGAHLGVQVADAPGGGAAVMAVEPGSPAAAAGLVDGDVVLAAGDRAIADGSALVAVVRAHEAGDEVTLTVRRGGEERAVDVELGTR